MGNAGLGILPRKVACRAHVRPKFVDCGSWQDLPTRTFGLDTAHPLYRLISELSRLRLSNPALKHGLTTIRGFDHEGPGLLAVERVDPETRQRVLIAFNTSGESIIRNIEVDYRARGLVSLSGTCPASVAAPGSVQLDLPPFGWAVCELVDR